MKLGKEKQHIQSSEGTKTEVWSEKVNKRGVI